jgi:hypothetical protein
MKQHRLISALGVFIALAMANVTLAQGPTSFPMVGITGAQTLQLNLVAYPPVPCNMVQLGFQNRDGVAVGPSETVSLQSGESISLALNGNSLVAADQRVELHPTVSGINGAATGASCVASVEVINNANGVTTVLAPGAVGFPPTPAFGMLGVTSLQAVRLNVVAYPPVPCIGTISWADINGNPIGTSLAVQLSPGEATHLDLPGGGALGQRAEVRPVVTVTSGACIASAEIYNIRTKGTRAVYYPPVPCAQSSSSCVVWSPEPVVTELFSPFYNTRGTAQHGIKEGKLQRSANPFPGPYVLLSGPDFFERLHPVGLLNSRSGQSLSVPR